MYNNKGAMFGLDARIALAIFGALSVISGAALYSAIKTAKVEKYRQYFVEVAKASEQYYLDTGQELTEFVAGAVESSQLVNNTLNLKNWNGPYISFKDYLSTYNTKFFIANMTQDLHPNIVTEIAILQKSTWSANNAAQHCSVNSSDCIEYVVLYSGVDATKAEAAAALKSLFSSMDELIDNGDGALAGKLRLLDYTNDRVYLVYQSRIRKRQVA